MVQVINKPKEKAKLKLIKQKQSYNIVIPKNVEEKIRHLCSVVHEVEWSGVLFYKKEGSFENNDLKITCVDIFPMDIGSGGFTDFDDTPDIASYRCEHLELLEEGIYEGLIHSHAVMKAFFSGTDTNTLLEEGTDRNHFVSLIVNNEGSYVAAVTRKIKQEVHAVAHIVYTTKTHYNTWDDIDIPLSDNETVEKDKEETKTIEYVEWYDLNITKEAADNDFNEIDDRLVAIKEAKAKKAYQSPYYGSSLYGKNSGYNNHRNWDEIDSEESERTPWHPNLYPSYGQQPQSPKTFAPSNVLSQGSLKEDNNQDDGTGIQTDARTDSTEETPLAVQYSFDNDLLNLLTAKLLTGNIASDVINYDNFVSVMDDKYEQLFGPLIAEKHTNIDKDAIKENNNRLKEWIASYVEFLVDTKDYDLIAQIFEDYGDDADVDDTRDICAFGIIKKLNAMPDSYVKNLMIKELKDYLYYGTDEYLSDK